jgi:hypothetical protein
VPDAVTGQQQAPAAPDQTGGAQPPPAGAPAAASRAAGWPGRALTLIGRLPSLLRRHWLFTIVAAGAVAVRAVVMLGFPPAMWFNDSYQYVFTAITHRVSTARPAGYPAFLVLLKPLHSFAVVAGAQHLMGLAMGVGIYAVLRRRGLPAWGASLAAVPVLYDAYQLQLEQQIMSDALFMALTTAAVLLLCWNDRLGVRVAVAAGLLIGLATIVRSVGIPLLVVVGVSLLAWRVGWRPLVALLGAGAVPIAGYMLVFYTQHGQFAMSYSSGTFLYGRVMPFADCAVIKPPPSLAKLCDPRPAAQRPIATEYIWRKENPLWQYRQGLFAPRVNARAQAFAVMAITAQPLDYLRAVNADFWRSFTWTRTLSYDWLTDHLYIFSIPPPKIRYPRYLPTLRAYQPGLTQPHAVEPFARLARAYQRQIYLRGTLLGLILLAGLAGLIARWRSWGGIALLPWLVAMLLLVLPVVVADFDYRYLLAVTPVACLAAGLVAGRQRAPRRITASDQAAAP